MVKALVRHGGIRDLTSPFAAVGSSLSHSSPLC